MYQHGQVELRSSALLRSHTADRPTFEATICRGWSRARQYQVFSMQPGLLFLERNDQKESTELDARQRGVLAVAMMGGAIGGLIGGMLVKPKTIDAKRETGLDLLSDEQLVGMARSRKRSFVVKHEEVLSISLDPLGTWDQLFGHRTLAGWCTMDTMSQGNLVLEFRDNAALAVAVDALPRRYGDRVGVHVMFDERKKGFVPRR